MHTYQNSSDPIATIGHDIGKNTFHLVGLDKRGAIAMRIKVSRNQLVRRLVNLSPCLIGLEAGSGSHHIARQIQPLGHDVRRPRPVRQAFSQRCADQICVRR